MTFKVWDVKAVEDNDEDVSYGTDCLKLHMDEPYYDGHPGINFLHCIRCSMLVLCLLALLTSLHTIGMMIVFKVVKMFFWMHFL